MSSATDREINVRALVWFAASLVLVMLVSAVVVLYFSRFLRAHQESQDPLPPALAAAREPYAPPGPRLQASPERELVDLREQEDSVLESYGWVDEAAGIARIPIDRAIALAVGDDTPPAAADPDEAAREEGGH